jgi:HK97 family phage portal protein
MTIHEVPRPDGSTALLYEYQLASGELRRIPSEWIVHLRGFGNDGVRGYSPAFQAREAIGAAAAAEKYAASFFGNDATPRLVLKAKKSFRDENALKNIRKSWEDRFQGLEQSHLVAILEEDMDVESIGLSPEDSQLITTREFEAEEIAARWFRVPPHKVGLLKRATFANIEHQSLEYLTDSLLPWLIRWEQRLTLDCLSPAERKAIFVEHKVEGILRADFETRMKGYRIAREMGLMSINEIRQLENLNPIGPEGDLYHVPLNWIELGTPPELAQAGGEGRTAELFRLIDRRNPGLPPGIRQDADEGEDEENLTPRQTRLVELRLRLRKRFRPLIRKAAQEIVNREAADIGRAAEKLLKRGREDFAAWLREFYESHPGFVREKLLPILQAYGEAIGDTAGDVMGGEIDEDELEAFVEDYLSGDNGRAEWYSGKALAQFFSLLEAVFDAGEDPFEKVQEKLDEWKENRADQMADLETVRAGGAFFVFVLNQFFSVTHWRWHAFGDSCPYCNLLHGRIVASVETFIAEGEAFGVELPGGPLVPSFNIHHEPAHGGCDCMVVPEIGG